MSEEMLKIKYPLSTRPTLVYTDKTGGINVAFNHLSRSASQQQIDSYKDNFIETFKRVYPNAEWKSHGVKEIKGRKVGYLELMTPAVDTQIYNLMFFTDLDGRLLLCTFNCVERKHKDWISPAQQIMNSLQIEE